MHPDLYSDTVRETSIELSRAVLDHQIDTLTAQNKDTEFEILARQVAQRLICPNLIPQTGPTGGGDAKVDSETFPVSPEISDRWWMGEPAAGNERWAFAFSAKRAWLPKVNEDVSKIIATKRGYKQIFFISNQNISDKKRAETQDRLSKEAGVQVTILDRNWLLTKIYENELLGLAVTSLQLVGNVIPREKAGPRDVARLGQLDELEAKIADPDGYVGAEYQLPEDALEAALASRGLERPRYEVEGKLLRAVSLADKEGYRPQQFRAIYNYAWTAHWWFEDFDLFNRLYDRAEELVLVSDSSDEVEKLQTLWSLFSTLVGYGGMGAAEAKLTERADRLRSRLETFVAESGRPNNALQAETVLATMRLADAMRSRDFTAIDTVWVDLADIVDRSEHLGAYPLEPVYGLIERIGEFIESEAYDHLFEKLIDVIAQRRSEGEAGTMLNRRAVQKMGHKRLYDAIRLFGKAEPLLIKEEYRGELVTALVGGGQAYHRVALPWAARAKALAAIDTCMATFKREGEMPSIIMRAIQGVIWAEATLGRVGSILSALGLSHLTEPRANTPPEVMDHIREERSDIDRILGTHLMNTPLADLPKLERLPEMLERMDLLGSAFALTYALGDIDAAKAGKFVPQDMPPEELAESIHHWRTQPILRGVASTPVLTLNGRSTFKSVVLGTRLEFDVQDEENTFGVAESVLAAFEAFLATSQEDDLVPRTEAVRIEVVAEEGKGSGFTLTFDDDDTATQGRLVHPAEMEFSSKAELSAFMNDIKNAVVGIMTRMFHIQDAKGWLRRLGDDERAFDRALIMANMLVLNSNVFGHPTGALLTGWLPENAPPVSCTRTKPLPSTVVKKEKSGPNARNVAQEPPPEGIFDPEMLTHGERKVVSPINDMRWSKAEWRGSLFVTSPEPDVPPVLGVGFTDAETGRKIFEELQARFGEYDEANDLRVAIIRGIDAENILSYAVMIGPNLENVDMRDGAIVMGFTRINRMTPQSHVNLDRFLAKFHQEGGFILAPAKMNPDDLTEADFFPTLGIAKTHLVVRDAWQLDAHDWDIMAIHEDDTPYVPEGGDASRVLEGLKRRKEAFAKKKKKP